MNNCIKKLTSGPKFQNRVLLFILLSIVSLYPVYLIFFLPIIGDDIQHLYSSGTNNFFDKSSFLDILKNVWNTTKGWYTVYHRQQGGYHLLTIVLYHYLLKNLLIYKIVAIISHIFTITLFGIFLKNLLRVSYTVIVGFILLVPAFFQFNIVWPDAIKSLYTAHVAFFQFLLLSWIFFLKFIESKKLIFYFSSLILYAFATQYFEVAFILAPVYFLLALSRQEDFKNSSKITIPFACIGIVCIALFVFANLHFPKSTYNVTEISLGVNTIRTFLYQFFSAFPLTHLSAYMGKSDNIYYLMSVYDWFYCLGVAIIAYIALRELNNAPVNAEKPNFFITGTILFIAWSLFVLPISALYNISFGSAYPFVYCQYYLLLGLVVTLLLAFKSKIKEIYPVFKWLFSGIFFICALGNTLSNKIVEEHYKPTYFIQNNFEDALKNGLLDPVESENSSIILLSKIYPWKPHSFFYHHSRKKMEVYGEWESFYKTHTDLTRNEFRREGYRKNRVDFLKVNQDTVQINSNDNVFSLSLIEKRSKTVFVLAKISKVSRTLSSSPVFETKEVFLLSAEKSFIQKEKLLFPVDRKVVDVLTEIEAVF